MLPDASEENVIWKLRGANIQVRLIPLSGAKTVCHHSRSDRNDVFRRMKLSVDLRADDS